MKNILRNALLAVTLCALPAMAGRDIYLLGDGSDGVLDVTTSLPAPVVINSYARVTTDAAVGATELLVDTNTGFSPGDLVLVHQSTGYTPEPTPGDISDINLTTGAVGRWELARLSMAAAEPGKLKLASPLLYAYTATGAQAVKVPEYTNVTIRGGAVLTASAWDGSKGGILAFLANGSVVIESAAAIDVTGKGFRGGLYVKDSTTTRRGCSGITEGSPGGAQRAEGVARGLYGASSTGRGNGANGGGGGVCYLAGGAGGGSAGRGGDGGKTHSSADGARAVGGIGGSKFSSTVDPLNRMVFGGGGGSGHGIVDLTPPANQGGAGGGIIFMRAQSLDGGDGIILANGGSGPTIQGNTTLSGAFGGGGGGTVYLRFAQLANCNVLSQGGRGGDTSLNTAFIGPGGGGGGGLLLLQSQTGSCTVFADGAVAGQTPTQRPGDTVNYGASPGIPGKVEQILNDGFPETMPVPVVVTPANGSSTNNLRPTFSGTLDPAFPPGSEIILTVTIGATTLTIPRLPAAANWSFTPTSDLAVGTYTVSAVLTKQEVYSQQSNTNTFTIDITAPAAPVVVTPANGSRTNDNTPTYTGTAEPGSTVTVRVDGTSVGTVMADASGNWTLTPTAPLANGSHTVNATATDAAGNVSPVSNTNTFTVDATPPTVVVQTPAEGSTTNDNTPTYSGTVSDNNPGPYTVEIRVDGTLLTTLTVPGPNWTYTPTTPLADGPHTVTATATDAVNNTATDSNAFAVDATPPTVVVQTPAEGSTTTDNTPTYSGTVEAGATVTLTVDGVAVGPVVVTGTTWTYTPTTPLADGPHTVTATATDAAGNTATDSNAFTVDATPPAVVVQTPAEGSTTTDNTPTYSGTVEAGATVTLTVDGVAVGPVVVTGTTWTYTPTTPLADGPHTVTATATDAAGNTATDSNAFTVDATPPAVVVQTPAEGSTTTDNTPTYSGTVEAGATVTLTVDGVAVGPVIVMGTMWTYTPTTPLADGPHTVTATATDAAGNTATDSNAFTVDATAPAVSVTTPAEGSLINDSTPVYSGTAEPGSSVSVSVDGTVVGTVTADASGNWTVTSSTPLPDGPHTVTATATDAAGNTATDSNTFTVDTVAPGAPVVNTPADGSTIADNTPTYSGTADPGSTVTISVDGTVVGTTTADSNGDWSFTPGTGISNGSHTVNATASDAAGNVSPVSNTNTFTVDASIPAAPVITGPANNTVTDDNTPVISGTAPPNSTVTVYVDGTPVGTTTSDAAGNWTFTPTTPLADGPHDITATTTNGVGNVSPVSNTVHITIDTGVPDTSIVSGPSGETQSTSATFEFGSTESGVTYECKLDGAAEFTECPNPATFANLAPGQHTLEVRARDSAGNVDPTPATATWTVVQTPPTGGDRDFLGDGIGCAASGGDPSALAMMGLGLLAVMVVRRRRQQ
ncbi:adventurous gliding motility protein AgmC [Hyalangium minutum]|uniref:Large repetitive protein n=1 Tax=Hyalangium minutum TaxID=394096 RepID=A0A085WLR9_9BACT|nr:Ig-like domain-containing protein [Hyalangium minutum]KFE68632.1 Large repetitive protein [Hyalangium minutum]